MNKPSPQNLARNRPDTGGDAVPGHGPPASFARQNNIDGRQHLRNHDRSSKTLHYSREYQESGGCTHPAQQRRRREEHDSPQVHPPVPVHIAEATTRDESAGIREGVAAHDEFESGLARPQRLLDSRSRDVHDEEVELPHERSDEQYRQDHALMSYCGCHVSTIAKR